MKELSREIVRMAFVAINMIVCGMSLLLAMLGFSGLLADAGVWENQGTAVVLLLLAVITGGTLLALFPESFRILTLRRFAYLANMALFAAGCIVLWTTSTRSLSFPDSLIPCAFALANIVALAVTGSSVERPIDAPSTS